MFHFFFVEMELEPCNLFNPLYLLEICHVIIFSFTCEMKSIAYHNIVLLKNLNNPINFNKTSLHATILPLTCNLFVTKMQHM